MTAATWFEGDGGEHSQKPSEVYALVEKLSPAPLYFEMFSRGGARDKWDQHGNEVGKHDRYRTAAPNEPDTISSLPVDDAEIAAPDTNDRSAGPSLSAAPKKAQLRILAQIEAGRRAGGDCA